MKGTKSGAIPKSWIANAKTVTTDELSADFPAGTTLNAVCVRIGVDAAKAAEEAEPGEKSESRLVGRAVFGARSARITSESMRLSSEFNWPSTDPYERVRFAAQLLLAATSAAPVKTAALSALHDTAYDYATHNTHPARIVSTAIEGLRKLHAWSKRPARIVSAQLQALEAARHLFAVERGERTCDDEAVKKLQGAARKVCPTTPFKGMKERSFDWMVAFARNCDGTRGTLGMFVGLCAMELTGVEDRSRDVRLAGTLWKASEEAREDLRKARTNARAKLVRQVFRELGVEAPDSGVRKRAQSVNKSPARVRKRPTR